jgi:hypothetical protein
VAVDLTRLDAEHAVAIRRQLEALDAEVGGLFYLRVREVRP